jgi:uncharacterized protein (DUF302 family)
MGTVLIGIIIGIAVTVVAEILTIRSKTVLLRSSRFGFEETVETLKQAVEEAGWMLTEAEDLKDSLRQTGIEKVRRICLLKAYKPEYVSELLREVPHTACFIPAVFAVYETDSSSVEVSKINTGIIGKVLGGVIAKVLGNSISADEAKILGSVSEIKPEIKTETEA